jgi:hypothetical protein
MANRTRFNSNDPAFKGDEEGNLGDVLLNPHYALDQQYNRGMVNDHIATAHLPIPVILPFVDGTQYGSQGWIVEEDPGNPGTFTVTPGIGYGRDDDNKVVRLETTETVDGLEPVDGTPDTPNYVVVRTNPQLSEAEPSYIDGAEYSKTITDGAEISVVTSYNVDRDIVLAVLFPTSVVGNVRLMSQPWRTRDLASATGRAGGGINLFPNSRLYCTETYDGSNPLPDGWSIEGDNPDDADYIDADYGSPASYEVTLSSGQGLSALLPIETIRMVQAAEQNVLSFELSKVGSGWSGRLTLLLQCYTVGWQTLLEEEIAPQYLTGWHRFAYRFTHDVSGATYHRLIVRNDTGGTCQVRLANMCLNVGKYALLVPVPTGIYTVQTLFFGCSGSLPGGPGGYLTMANLNGDDFELPCDALLGRIRVHARTAGTGGNSTIKVRRSDADVKSLTLVNDETSVAAFGDYEPFTKGDRISVFGTGPLSNQPQNVAVSVDLYYLTGV